MKRQILFIVITAIVSTASFAHAVNDSIQLLQQRVEKLEALNSRLSAQVRSANSHIKNLEGTLLATSENAETLKKDLAATNSSLLALSDKFELQLRDLSDKTGAEITALQNDLNQITLYWILTVSLMVLLASVIFFSMKTRFTKLRTALSDQIRVTSKVTREEIVKLDNQMFWLLDLHKRDEKTEQKEAENADHTLALKVADEIFRIQKNIGAMDPESKGVKQLEFAVDRIQDNFRENGYMFVELLNKPYDENMNILAKFKIDNTLKPGEKIITRIIKPQIKYKNITIQNGEVEVSTGSPQS